MSQMFAAPSNQVPGTVSACWVRGNQKKHSQTKEVSQGPVPVLILWGTASSQRTSQGHPVPGNSNRDAPMRKCGLENLSVNDFWQFGSYQMGPGRDFYELSALPRQSASGEGQKPVLLSCLLH